MAFHKANISGYILQGSNHSEILALYEASHECVWLISIIHHIRSTCYLSLVKNTPTTIYEDNDAGIAQIKAGYIKGDRTKHISPKFFHTHELQENQEIEVKQIRSSDNLADLFTNRYRNAHFKNWCMALDYVDFPISKINTYLSGGDIHHGESAINKVSIHCTLFPLPRFLSHRVFPGTHVSVIYTEFYITHSYVLFFS